MQLRPTTPLVSACTVALVVATVGVTSPAAPAAPHAPTVTVTLGSNGPTISGPRRWQPGAVRIVAASRLPDQELTLLHFQPGYSYARFQADGKHANGHNAAARAALRRVFANTVFDGGVDLFRGQSASVTVTVRPGTYYLGELARRPELTPIRVSGPTRARPPAAAGIVTVSDSGFRIDRTLPAVGTITIRNRGSQPHRVNLVPVKPGTTRAQVGAYLRKTAARDNAPPPPFALKAPQLGSADISPGQQMQLTYKLPAGEYALIDFGQDPRSGEPEALKGMYAVATLD